jgi:Xaa-Pro aminopeptidase
MDYRDEVYFRSRPEAEVPFPPEEFHRRLDGLRRRMQTAGIDMLYLMAPESMYYLSGYQCEWYQAQSPRQWPASSAIAVHTDHDRFILFDSEREAILGRIFTTSQDTRLFPRDSMRDGAEFAVRELQAEDWLTGKVGLEMGSYRPNRLISEKLEALFRATGVEVIDGTDLLRQQRWIKSPAEIDCLKEAARIANIGMMAAKAALRIGITELEVYGEMVRAMAAAGGENPGITMPVLSGTKTNALHALATRRRIQAGDIVAVDLCGVYKRYHVNMARSFSMGEPARDVRETTDRIAQSMPVLRGLLRPNLPVRELNQAIRDYFEAAGLWDKRGWLGGYEMGIAFPPDWVGNFVYDPLSPLNADRFFEPGTAVNYENQFFLPRHIGQYFAIDSFLFTETEAKGLTEMPFELMVIEG